VLRRFYERISAQIFAPSVMLALLAMLAFGAEAQPQQYSEDVVKAAFLYHFGTYVEWPRTAAPQEPVTIAVLGASSVASQLSAFLPGRRIQDRPVEVRPIERIQDLGDDEVLFIGSDNNERLPELIEAVGSRAILIVTDADDGLGAGAMVNFKVVDQRVKFEISLRKAQDSGLQLSSRLLSAALRVETSRCSDGECGRPRANLSAKLKYAASRGGARSGVIGEGVEVYSSPSS
jgi:hypothetical protein